MDELIEPNSVWRRVTGARERRWCAACGRFSMDGYLCVEGGQRGEYACRSHHIQRTGPAPEGPPEASLFDAET